MAALPLSVDATFELLAQGDYVGDRPLATALHLALSLGRPLFLEGEAGVGEDRGREGSLPNTEAAA